MMLDYIARNIYNMSMLLDLAKIKENHDDVAIFEDITLPVLVGMYCSPGLKFAAGPFKSDLEKCEIKTINALKIYQALQSLSVMATNDSKSRKNLTAPELTNTPSESDDVMNILGDGDDVDDDVGQASPINLGITMQESYDVDGVNKEQDHQLENEDFLAFIVRTEDV